MSTMTTATTILAQLGGNKFVAMTGAKHLLGSADALQFKIGTGAKDGINSVRIVLDASDTYSVTFYKIRGLKVAEVKAMSGLYADTLRAAFTAVTGFDTSL